jgi:hypothetical protein
MPLLLGNTAAESVLDLRQAMTLTREIFREQAAGGVVAVAPRMVTAPRGHLRIVMGALLDSARMGARLGSTGRAASGADDRYHTLLYDTETGQLLAIIAAPFGTIRAACGVQKCAPLDSGVRKQPARTRGSARPSDRDG